MQSSELARLAAQRILLAEDGGGVAQPERPGLTRHAGRHHARDGKGHVGTQYQLLPVSVEQPEGIVGRHVARVDEVALLEQGRLDWLIAGFREAPRHVGGDPLSPQRLFGQDVAHAARGGQSHEGHPFEGSN